MYTPTTDQFLSVDPDVATTHQPYDYAGDDPTNKTDPSGLDCAGGRQHRSPWRISLSLTRAFELQEYATAVESYQHQLALDVFAFKVEAALR
jgi:hypothetical protein